MRFLRFFGLPVQGRDSSTWEMVPSCDPGKESEAGQMDFQRYLQNWERREGQMGHALTFGAVSLHKLVHREASLSCLAPCSPSLRNGEKMQRKKLATLDKGRGKGRFSTFAVFQNWEPGRDLPPLSLSKALSGTGEVEQEVGVLITGLMVWVEVSQAKQERKKLSVLSDSTTVDQRSFLEAVLF